VKHATYTRLYADDLGESHFEELEVALAPVDFAPPAAPLNVAPFLPTAESLWIGIPVGWAGENPHPAPRRQVFCTARGDYEVTASDGDARRFPAGSVLLLEDTYGKGHSTHIIGEEGALVFAVVLRDSQEAG
jgi:hypothetical protein